MYRLRKAVWYESYFQFFDANKWAAVTFFSFHGFLLVIFFYTRNQYIINVIWIRKLWQTYRPQKWFYLDLLAISWCCQRMNERTTATTVAHLNIATNSSLRRACIRGYGEYTFMCWVSVCVRVFSFDWSCPISNK